MTGAARCGARCVSSTFGPIRTLDPIELLEEGVHVHECGKSEGHRALVYVSTADWETRAHLCSCGFAWP